ncbi:MAG: 1-(5-phosphoribosyl)-5-((5-phosphoribosylamino)methylideneamino)imidazole-4-carboxamide isomerase, partial [Campylobacteraceae bacterium]|nr:1-(5-phosphoribosyl)-5-((5-phosphoribosylamino)methylideneamino)imidazole-4-carboxamide isomerase [Campylobacteraceae bacterium]
VNLPFTLEIARASGLDTIASGGVRDMGDIDLLLECKEIAGVIVGKAFYEGTLDLRAAIAKSKIK